MSNLSGSLNTFTVEIDLKNSKEGLVKLFDADADFTENEEYFRKDTLKLGYENEAERVVAEYLKKQKVTNQKELCKAIKFFTKKIFSSSCYGGHTETVIEIGEKTIFKPKCIVVVTYIS